MAFTSTLTAAIGLATKLSHLNEVFQNTKWLKDKILGDGGEGSGATGHLHPPGCASAFQVERGSDLDGTTVTFTTAFDGVPTVATAQGSSSTEAIGISSVTSTGFQILYQYGNVTMHWVAVRGTLN